MPRLSPVYQWLCLGPFLACAFFFMGEHILAGDSIRFQEAIPTDYQYHVSTRVDLSGQLTVPGKNPLSVKGTSAIEYDERVLIPGSNGKVEKTLRIYRRMEFERKVGDQLQKSTLRPEVRRLVVLRNQNVEVPFCPEGPLTWGEIDMVRTDVFTPALTGLLPDRPVRPGDRWKAAMPAVQELTDLERIEEGQVECRLESLVTLEKRRHARIVLSGTVRGTNEDGPNRQQLEGYFYFDLESNHLSYLSLHGIHSLLDKDGKEAGRVEGQFVLTRQVGTTASELANDSLRGLTLEPNPDNTLLLYDNPELGLRFLYPRRWHVAGGMGRQVRLDGADGSGLLLTLEPPARLPNAAGFLNESRAWFQSQKAKVLRVEPPQRVQGGERELDHFLIEIDMAGRHSLMDYYLLRQAQGGVTLAASLPTADPAALQKEIARIARSLAVTKPIKAVNP